MTVADADMVLVRASANNDTTSNGGALTETEITDGAAENLFPHVTDAERTAGLTRYRKAGFRNKNASDLSFQNFLLWISQPSTADDYFFLLAGTKAQVQSDISGSSDWVATGVLDANASAGAVSIDVEFPSAAGVQDGDTIRLDDGAGTVEFATVDGSVSWTGNVATVPLSTGLSNGFSAGDQVAGVVDLSDVETSFDTWVETSAAGTYDESTYPLTLYNVGTIDESWTLTFTSATEFSVSGASVGVVGTGTISGDFQPANGASYYFKLLAAGFGGTWASGDTITFKTYSAGVAFWLKQVVPAATSAYTGSTVKIAGTGESA